MNGALLRAPFFLGTSSFKRIFLEYWCQIEVFEEVFTGCPRDSCGAIVTLGKTLHLPALSNRLLDNKRP